MINKQNVQNLQKNNLPLKIDFKSLYDQLQIFKKKGTDVIKTIKKDLETKRKILVFLMYIYKNIKYMIKWYKLTKKEFDRHLAMLFAIIKKNSALYNFLFLTFLYWIAINNLEACIPSIENSPFQELLSKYPAFEFIAIKPKIEMAASEITFLIYVFVTEVLITRGGSLGLSLTVRYHIIYILIIESILSFLICTWDSVFYLEITPEQFLEWSLSVNQTFYHSMFWLFFLILVSGYYYGLKQKIPVLPFFQKIPDSVAFWLRIKKKEKKRKKNN